jgi:hypothetical protein
MPIPTKTEEILRGIMELEHQPKQPTSLTPEVKKEKDAKEKQLVLQGKHLRDVALKKTTPLLNLNSSAESSDDEQFTPAKRKVFFFNYHKFYYFS